MPKNLTEQEHAERHKLLHKNFDELLADFIDKTGKSLTQTNLLEFVDWSYKQTIKPDIEHAPIL